MASKTTLFRVRVPVRRLKNAARVLEQLGLKPGDAFNILLAQIELHKGLPFPLTTTTVGPICPEEQAQTWTNAFGPY
jgi:addiction module RelB/DinJ family antitoxin